MMKKFALWLSIFLAILLLVACTDEGLDDTPPLSTPSNDAPVGTSEPAGSSATDEVDGSEGIEPEAEPEPEQESTAENTVPQEEEKPTATPLSFMPITVEDLGIETVVPADWPKIEDDSLLEYAWGPGQYTFIAFYVVPGEDTRAAMAELLNSSTEQLVNGSVEGSYAEEQLGNHDWALYSINNPEVNLAQSVSMTVQDGKIYVVSLFVETNDQEAIMQAALENFVITTAGIADGGESPPAEIIDLPGTSWVMVSYNDGTGQMIDVLSGQIITIVFDNNGRVSGFAGCNNYGSLYTTEGDQLSIENPAITNMICDTPEGIMLQETSFLGNLVNTSRFQATKNDLVLFDNEGKTLLNFWTP